MPSILNATTTNGLVTSADNSGSLQLATNNGTTAVTIDTSQRVGIGTASPNEALAIARGSGATAGIEMAGNNNTLGTTSLFVGQGGDSQSYLWQRANQPLNFGTNNTERMRIDSSGNVGIGTNSPAGRLHVVGTSDQIRCGNGTNTAFLGASGSSGYTGTLTNDPFLFYTNSAERMRITSGGNLLVGTTGSTPGYGNTDTGVSIVSTNPSCFSIARTDFVQVLNNNTSDAGTFYLINFRTNNGNRGSITSNGTGVTYGTLSDYRLKENVAPMTGALSKVAQLKPVTYKWKENGSDGQGFLAHELQAVVPECVVGEKDAVDEEGNPKYQGVDTSFLVATLTAAIQELKAELDATKAEVQALKGVA